MLEGLLAIQRQIQQEPALKNMKRADRAASYAQPKGPIIIRGDYAPIVPEGEYVKRET